MEFIYLSLIVLSTLVGCLFVIVNRYINCLNAHVSDDNRVATPELIKVWKKQITNHEPGSAAYESYKAHLIRANERVPD